MYIYIYLFSFFPQPSDSSLRMLNSLLGARRPWLPGAASFSNPPYGPQRLRHVMQALKKVRHLKRLIILHVLKSFSGPLTFKMHILSHTDQNIIIIEAVLSSSIRFAKLTCSTVPFTRLSTIIDHCTETHKINKQ